MRTDSTATNCSDQRRRRLFSKGHEMDHPKGTIVVVEDNVCMNHAISHLLILAGYRAVTFLSAETLLACGATPGADCLLVDIHLPGMNGFELCRRLQEQGIELPVIFMSAHTDAAWSAAAHDAGAIAFITKPFRGQVLLTA